MRESFNLLGEIISPVVLPTQSLVYRKSQKSANIYCPRKRVYDFKDFISITPNAVYLYSRNIAPNDRDYTNEWLNKGATINDDGSLNKANCISTKRNTHSGIVSNKANKNIQKCIDWMVCLASDKPMVSPEGYGYTFRLNFITLTLSSKQVHSDAFIKSNLLQPFLNYIRKKEWKDAGGKSRKLKYYFWRAETQTNGNIHFHLCTDIYINKKIIQWEWNRFQEKIGYVQVYQAKFGKKQPPSTHVRSVHKVAKIAKYLSKYCGKNTKGVQLLSTGKGIQSGAPDLLLKIKAVSAPTSKTQFFRPVYGRLWGCSENLSRLKKSSVLVSDAISCELAGYISKNPKSVHNIDFCRIVKIDLTQCLQLGLPNLRSLVIRHVNRSLAPPT